MAGAPALTPTSTRLHGRHARAQALDPPRTRTIAACISRTSAKGPPATPPLANIRPVSLVCVKQTLQDTDNVSDCFCGKEIQWLHLGIALVTGAEHSFSLSVTQLTTSCVTHENSVCLVSWREQFVSPAHPSPTYQTPTTSHPPKTSKASKNSFQEAPMTQEDLVLTNFKASINDTN